VPARAHRSAWFLDALTQFELLILLTLSRESHDRWMYFKLGLNF
jgi:hypothetical protein